MKRFLLVIVGLLPLLIGYLMNRALMTIFFSTMLPLGWIGLIMLGLWCLISYKLCGYAKNVKQAIFLLNLPALTILILNAVQLLIIGKYWSGFIGYASQFFYLPLMNISFNLAWWSHKMMPVIFVAFILMVAASALGCLIRKRRRL